MRNRIKAIALALGVVALLGALGAGVAFAQTPAPGSSDWHNAFLSRVANILGVEQQALADAIKQASGEMIEEAVQEGRIPQEKAAWMKQRLEDGSFKHGLKGMLRSDKRPGRMGSWSFEGRLWRTPAAPTE